VDVQINSQRVRTEREKRAWSQEQLGMAAGLSLRTIQRVETTGAGSLETLKSLAAVFSIDVSELRAAEPAAADGSARPGARPRWHSARAGYAALASALVLVAGGLFATNVFGSQVHLDLVLTLNDKQLGRHQLTTTPGRGGEIVYGGQLKIVVIPTVTSDGSILISMRVDDIATTQYVRIGEPKVLAHDGGEAKLSLTSAKGDVLGIAVRAEKI
jgi:transcriptional regulator with XRE-family HTH domain